MIYRMGRKLVRVMLALAVLAPSTAQTPLTGRAAILVGGSSGKNWKATGTRAGEFNEITFESDGVFMAVEKNKITSGRWSVAENGRTLYLFNRASGNWHNSDTLALRLVGISSSRLSVRYKGGSGRTVRYYPTDQAVSTP